MGKRVTIVLIVVTVLLIVSSAWNIALYKAMADNRQAVRALENSLAWKEANDPKFSSDTTNMTDWGLESATDTKQDISLANKRVMATVEEVDKFEKAVSSSLRWFQANANITTMDDPQLEAALKRECSASTIPLACLSQAHTGLLTYKSDTIDRLQNLSSIAQNHGGDCEDLSVLAVAEINFLKSADRRFEAWRRSKGKTYRFGNHSIADAEPYLLPLDYTAVATVCGDFPSSNGMIGHCVIAFTPKPINSSDDVVKALSTAILIEPQSGRLIADLRLNHVFTIPLVGPRSSTPSIYLVITDNDLCRYTEIDGEYVWLGFQDLNDQLLRSRELLTSPVLS